MGPSRNTRFVVNRLRQQLAFLLLACEKETIASIAYRLGYSNPYHFSNQFYKTMGFRPSQWWQHIAR